MIKSFRQIFGLSQTYLADYLRITRSQLSMAEINQRLLPAEKMLILLKFYNIVIKSPAVPAQKDETDTPNGPEIEKLAERLLLTYKVKLYKAQRQLDKLTLTLNSSKTVLAHMHNLRAVATPDDENFIEIIYYEAQRRKRLGEQEKVKLELQLCSLSAQINYLEAQHLKADDSDFTAPVT